MEDKKKSGKDAAFAENTMLIDAEEGKAPAVLPIPESSSQAMRDQNKKSPLLEGSEAVDAKLVEENENELPHSRDDHRPVETAKAHLKDSGQPHSKDLEPPSKGDEADKQGVLDPSVAIAADTDDLDGSTAHQSHPDSITPNKPALETKEDNKAGELDYVGNRVKDLLVSVETNENERSNRAESPVRNETENKNSNTGVMGHALASKVEIRKEDQDNAVTRIELVPDNERKKVLNSNVTGMEQVVCNQVKEEPEKIDVDVQHDVDVKTPSKSFLLDPNTVGNESGTKEEQAAFFKDLETFHKDNCLEFKPPRFYGEPLNLLKLWRAVIKLGGYEQVTSCKLWRQVGESFKPPK